MTQQLLMKRSPNCYKIMLRHKFLLKTHHQFSKRELDETQSILLSQVSISLFNYCFKHCPAHAWCMRDYKLKKVTCGSGLSSCGWTQSYSDHSHLCRGSFLNGSKDQCVITKFSQITHLTGQKKPHKCPQILQPLNGSLKVTSTK